MATSPLIPPATVQRILTDLTDHLIDLNAVSLARIYVMLDSTEAGRREELLELKRLREEAVRALEALRAMLPG